ncbi:MAG: trigger factor [Firmicutes bacterium]|nr:trigger factor [Bacillota bacterium]
MVKLEKIDDSKVALEVEVDAEVVAGALDEAYKKVVKKVSVPGFRKGKVPRAILERRFGPEILYEDALDILLPRAYGEAVEETGIKPIDRPEIDLVQFEKGKPFIFKAVVEVLPEVKLGEYRGIEATQEIREITEQDVESRLQQMRTQHVRLHVVEEGPVEFGDLVIIDFTGFVDGEPLAGGSGEGYSLEIGSNTFIPGFEVQLVGMKIGEEKEIEVRFPEQYHREELSGKLATFKVKVNEIKRKELPELTDEFVQEVSEFETLAELKADILNKLKEQEKERSRFAVQNEIVGKVVTASEVAVPNVLVEREIDRMLAEMNQLLMLQGLTLEKYLEMSKKTLEELRADRREEAERRVKTNLVLEAIITQEGIDASDAEIDERLQEIAESYKQDLQKVKEAFAAEGQLSQIADEIKYRKVIDFLTDAAKITEKTVPAVQNEEAQNAEAEEATKEETTASEEKEA